MASMIDLEKSSVLRATPRCFKTVRTERIWITRWWAGRSATKGAFYDESNRRMDGWLDGRRNVVLVDNRCAGGGPAGCRD